ncbi:MAG: GNAT family N-acetyltransferase [Anaerolineales bacterium]
MLDLSETLAVFPVLETDRLVLRQVTADDTEAIFRMLADPAVTRYLGRQPFSALDQAASRVQAYADEFKARTGLAWAVTQRSDGQFMGLCRYTQFFRFHYRAEIGYLLSRAWWGQGVMPEAVSAALDFGFTRLGLHSVQADIDPANNQSRRLLEKLGFVQEAMFRESFYIPHLDRFDDSAVFSLLGSAWARRPEPD